ncbi:hypothetical protein OEZ60_19775 [Defluviimonas sp. WL0024]|uniref:Membrane-anchored ribosome-binding protein, inhibits growth in stationary phase, ElaB/YqjD/DUF883 family n=1 Tax=Albidovulum salinarum TaxID=2984153 RepID=A0ABT2X8F8_9RHOB|nr:hypothetical protein [Defluviimonas sp. WL0024]MCU9850233.1 hypothetical protein [Defluviimonas sp. WL0024]
MTGEKLKKSVSEMAEAVKERGAETLSVARKEAGDVAERAGGALKDAATNRAETGKDMLSDQGKALADRLRTQAEEDRGTFRARLLNVVADGVSEASEDLRGRSLNSILEKTEDFARQHPGAFVAGAAVAGFALARFARASARPRQESDIATLPLPQEPSIASAVGPAHAGPAGRESPTGAPNDPAAGVPS